MRSNPTSHGSEQLVPFENGEFLRIDRAARLEEGDAVAVFWEDRLAMVGRLGRRPVPHRRYVVDVNEGGKVRRHRQFGPHDEAVSIYRVVGRLRVVPI